MSSDASTPLMRQYNGIKQQVPNALLMFRLGDFYELFFEDAVVAARELEITLTSRNKEKGAAIPMCGVPYHAAEGYIARLIQKGYRVAICDQMEDPKLAKKLVKREITRVVTPGTAMDAQPGALAREQLPGGGGARPARAPGVAHVDVSTGEFRVTELEPGEVAGALEQLGAREVLFAAELPLLAATATAPAARFVRTELEDWVFSADYADRTLRDHFKLLSLDGCGLANRPAAVGAAGAILHYLRETQRARARPSRPAHLLRPRRFHGAGRGDGAQPGTGRAAVRGRCRRRRRKPRCWPCSTRPRPAWAAGCCASACCGPRSTAPKSKQRLDAVGELLQQTILRAELRKQLGGILDLERLLAKVTLGTAGPRDLLALGRSLEKIPALKRCVRYRSRRPVCAPCTTRLDELADVANLILEAIADEPPLDLADGGTIRAGFHAELDELRDLQPQRPAVHRADRGARAAAHRHPVAEGALQQRLRLLHRNHARQPAPGARRLRAQADAGQRRALHHAGVEGLRAQSAGRRREDPDARKGSVRATCASAPPPRRSASAPPPRRWRSWTSPRRWRRWPPRTATSARRFPTAARCASWPGRHPVIERLAEQEAGRFIPNDLYLNDAADLIAIITGPNMGGKSTYLRQAALIAILAQMGSFVPAESASLPLIDRIFTRIGASDNLARGPFHVHGGDDRNGGDPEHRHAAQLHRAG